MTRVRFAWRRAFPLYALMVGIAVLAMALSQVRRFAPIGSEQAVGIAKARLREVPGSAAWAGRTTRAVRITSGWCVDFLDPATGIPSIQIVVDPQGRAAEPFFPSEETPLGRGSHGDEAGRALGGNSDRPKFGG
jgi:hypothetical protein